MRTASRIFVFLLVALAAFWFTAANSGERVTIDLVLLRLTAPLPLVVFGSVLVGMIAVALVGVRADLETRRSILRYREVAARSTSADPVSEPPRFATEATDEPMPAAPHTTSAS